MKGSADYLELGSWNTVCYQCGKKKKASYLVRNWQGYYVCPEHNEPRHPQDFVRGVPDAQTPPWTQPMPVTVFRFDHTFLGLGDGEQLTFQLGDGLYPTVVTAVFLDDTPVSGYTADGYGLITFSVAPAAFVKVSASGMETT